MTNKQDGELSVYKSNESNEGKAWSVLELLLTETSREQKKSRRWKVFFKLLMFIYLFALLALLFKNGSGAIENIDFDEPYVVSVAVQGVIADQNEADAEIIIKGLQKAFKQKQAKAVIVKINSPGGSPVQSGYVYDEINRLKNIHPEKKVIAVIEDIGASGAYYIAAAADEIYADKASLVGSIGVISPGFGFTEVMKKIGVERRVYSSGGDKSFLDPFSKQDPSQKQFWQGVLEVTHKQFIQQVKLGRKNKLKGGDEVFSGLIWTGEQALELGLIDHLGSAETAAYNVANTRKIIDMSFQEDPFKKLVSTLGMSMKHYIANIFMINEYRLY
jgi:protease IV